MRVAIIGCGFIGQKRAQNLGNARLILCADTQLEYAEQLAKQFPEAVAIDHWQKAVANPDVDILIVATPHISLSEIMQAGVVARKHVLVEKPAALKAALLPPIIKLAHENNVLVRVGFNHRYHRALQKAKSMIDEDKLGSLMFVRARYGHGGRVGYDKEWRANPKLSGGGELIDQGIHLIDLARWFLGDFSEVQGHADTYYWNMPVEDNGFMLLKTPTNKIAFLHASCTEWKNIFSFEIYGKKAKLEIQGLGGSYGHEKLYYYKMLPTMGPPETTIWEYPMADNSWSIEFQAFLEDISKRRKPNPGLEDAFAALHIVEKICKDSGYDYYT